MSDAEKMQPAATISYVWKPRRTISALEIRSESSQ